ncbi:hypothetical protein BDD12DRAFT_908568 [Trichophaea hybrida]|nr:hypothetical protein BDD12DRAFT_908568 [Trichophaea hybrida]
MHSFSPIYIPLSSKATMYIPPSFEAATITYNVFQPTFHPTAATMNADPWGMTFANPTTSTAEEEQKYAEEITPPELKHQYQNPTHLQLPSQSTHKILLSHTAAPGYTDSLQGLVYKTTSLFHEKLWALEQYAERQQWGWCSCPRGWHEEVEFVEEEMEGVLRRCVRRKEVLGKLVRGEGGEVVDEEMVELSGMREGHAYGVKKDLGGLEGDRNKWLGVVVDQGGSGEVVYPSLGACAGWEGGVVGDGMGNRMGCLW